MIDPEQLDLVLTELRRVTRRNFWIDCVKMAVLIVSLLVYFWWVL
jgi:hypothetical protein